MTLAVSVNVYIAHWNSSYNSIDFTIILIVVGDCSPVKKKL